MSTFFQVKWVRSKYSILLILLVKHSFWWKEIVEISNKWSVKLTKWCTLAVKNNTVVRNVYCHTSCQIRSWSVDAAVSCKMPFAPYRPCSVVPFDEIAVEFMGISGVVRRELINVIQYLWFHSDSFYCANEMLECGPR